MRTILKLFVAIVVFATATTAVKEGDESLIKILANERKEMREIFQRENARLADEDQKLKQQNDQLQQQVTKQNQQLQRQNDQLLQRLEKQDEENAKQNQEIVKQNQMQQQQQQVIAKLQDQNRKLHQKLRHAELESKKAARQNDQREKLNVKKVIKTELLSRGRNDSLELELKKYVKAEINEFLISEKVCVGGTDVHGDKGGDIQKTVDFGYTFPRKPMVVASANYCYKGDKCGAFVRKVTKSSAVIGTYSQSPSGLFFSWMACL